MKNQSSEGAISRRGLTKTLGAVAAASLAGCLGGDDDDDDGATDRGDSTDPDELGERVPTLTMRYFAGIYATRFSEAVAPLIIDSWDDALGIDVETDPSEVATWVGELFEGGFNYDMNINTAHTTPDRLDPNFIIRDFYRIDGAGTHASAGQSLNWNHYANCEYSMKAWEQEFAGTEEERRELVYDAQEIFAEDYAAITLGPQGSYGAADTARVQLESLGEFGINNHNAFNLLESHTVDGSRKRIAVGEASRIRSLNPYLSPNPMPRLLSEYALLATVDPDGDLVPYLAESWDIDDSAEVFEFTLRDATFQNGDPITPEDVAFTFEFLEANNGDLDGASGIGFESVEVVDDDTVRITFPRPNLSFMNERLLSIGILNEDVWAEADGNAGEFSPEPGTASGPFEVVDFEGGEFMVMDTHTGHPEAPDPDDMEGIILEGFAEEATMVQALGAGEIDQISDVSFSAVRQAGEFDGVETTDGFTFIPYTIMPMYPTPPTKFREFRQALGMPINRHQIQAAGLPGEDVEPELHPRPFMEDHPWAAPADRLVQFTDDPEGDVDGARDVLSAAGWGWDDDGNLHYPPDADLEPLWTEGEAPEADDFPCIDEIMG